LAPTIKHHGQSNLNAKQQVSIGSQRKALKVDWISLQKQQGWSDLTVKHQELVENHWKTLRLVESYNKTP
jgi:hypothetical protein